MSDLDKFRKILHRLGYECEITLTYKMSEFEMRVYSINNSYINSIYFNLDGSLKEN